MDPIVIVNFKTYERGTGASAVELARTCASFGAGVAVQAVDIRACEGDVYAQHVDGVVYGKGTGHVLAEAVKEAGAIGTLLNHSEYRLDRPALEASIARCREVGLKIILCAESLEEAESFLSFDVDYLAVEIPELIGGDVSIMSARPGIVREAVEKLGSNVLLGAGVHSGEDLKIALEEGAAGVLLASAVVKKAEDPRAALEELYSTLR